MFVVLEIEAAQVAEQRRKALDNDLADDLRFDCMSWSHDSLHRWERTMMIQHREWEADKERVISLFDEKV